jgi:hypothetical protein
MPFATTREGVSPRSPAVWFSQDGGHEAIRSVPHARTFRGHVVNGFYGFQNGGDVWYTFSTEGKLATALNGMSGCEVTG